MSAIFDDTCGNLIQIVTPAPKPEDLDLPRIRLHDLRHTHATILLQQGINPKVVSERLGHASVSFTMDVYQHVLPGMQAQAAATFGTAIFGDP